MSKYSELLEQSLKEKNIGMVRSCIVEFMNSDKFREQFLFQEVAKYAAGVLSESGIALFENDDEEWVLPPKSEWNKDVWCRLKIKIMYNFSHEKLDAMGKIMSYLRKSGHQDFQVKCARRTNAGRAHAPTYDGEMLPVEEPPARSSFTAKKTGINFKIKTIGDHDNDFNPKQMTAVYIITGATLGLGAGAVVGAKIIGIIVGIVLGGGISYHIKQNHWRR